MQDFKMSGSNMNELLTNMKAIKERIDDSYDEFQEYKDMEDM